LFGDDLWLGVGCQFFTKTDQISDHFWRSKPPEKPAKYSSKSSNPPSIDQKTATKENNDISNPLKMSFK
jgi:hypothetical protein